jgi:DegV family protein with EDD domain
MSMGSIAILTDSTAQFTLPSFNGRSLVKILPFNIQCGGTLYEAGRNLKPAELPLTLNDATRPRLLPPTIEQIRQFLSQDENGHPYDEVMAIFLSSSMSPLFEQAVETQKQLSGRTRLQIVDSQTTSVGLGMLVQSASDAVAKGASLANTERLVRSLIPHIYAVLCTPSLTYLHYAGFLDRAQAAVGEMLGLFSLFSLEEGKLTPLEKVRNHRQMLDFFQEFLEEFDHLQHIGFLQSAVGGNPQDGRILRDHAQVCLPRTPFSEHSINLPTAALFGPNAMGLFVVEPNHLNLT